MLGSSRERNVCTLAVELDGQLDYQTLTQQLFTDPVYGWITSLRLKIGLPFALSRWRRDDSAIPPEIELIDSDVDYRFMDKWVVPAIDPRMDSPVRISLVQQLRNQSILVVSWHHSLMDAHGCELLIRYLGCPNKSVQPLWLQDLEGDDDVAMLKRLLHDQETKKGLYEISKPPLLSLGQCSGRRPSPKHRVMRFSKQETLQISHAAESHGAGFMLSAYYLASTAKSFSILLRQRGEAENDILVPVPQDRRKRGANGPVLRNQVTFLFYRIGYANLANLASITTDLVEQMKQLMRSDAPSHYLNMMNRLQRVPGVVYRWLLKHPTQGCMASFFYSDTGDSLNGLQNFLGLSIANAIHYPPNIYPPGMTFIYTRFQGGLQITCSYMQELVTDAEMNMMMGSLRRHLLSGDGVSPESSV